MPNGGSDCCGNCKFNSLNGGKWAPGPLAGLEAGHCTIRGTAVATGFYTYCWNQFSGSPIPKGPVCVYWWSFGRIPCIGSEMPKPLRKGTCSYCKSDFKVEDERQEGVIIRDEKGHPRQFCSVEHYIAWWEQSYPEDKAVIDEWPMGFSGSWKLLVEAENAADAETWLEKGVYVNVTDDSGFTALMKACERGDTSLVELLVERGARLDKKNSLGQTALTIAEANGWVDIADFLIKSEAKTRRSSQYTLSNGSIGNEKVEMEKKFGGLPEKTASSMTMRHRIHLIKGDITKVNVDAIVNAANNQLLGGSGVDGAIHLAAGPELKEECRQFNWCDTGDARITRGFRLPAKYVIHTPGPIWMEGKNDEAKKLESCYRRCMELAHENGVKTIAFPSISTGLYNYPMEEASEIALRTVLRELERFSDIQQVIFVLRPKALKLYKKTLNRL